MVPSLKCPLLKNSMGNRIDTLKKVLHFFQMQYLFLYVYSVLNHLLSKFIICVSMSHFIICIYSIIYITSLSVPLCFSVDIRRLNSTPLDIRYRVIGKPVHLRQL